LGYSNANKLARQVEELGFIRDMTGQRRHRVDGYAAYLELFKESG